jgi:hypothetical protein
MTAPTITPELRALLRRVKLGRCLDTLPERLALAATGGLGHAEFLELVLADEVTRRETTSADRRARAAGCAHLFWPHLSGLCSPDLAPPR